MLWKCQVEIMAASQTLLGQTQKSRVFFQLRCLVSPLSSESWSTAESSGAPWGEGWRGSSEEVVSVDDIPVTPGIRGQLSWTVSQEHCRLEDSRELAPSDDTARATTHF